MTKILSPLSVEYIDNCNLAILAKPFGFVSDVLIKHHLRQVGWNLRPSGHEEEFWAPAKFVFDFESTPNWLRGPLGVNKRGGAAHDPVCRKDVIVCWDGSCPGITKSIAADVYFEIMNYCDSIDTQRFAKSEHPYLPGPIIIPYVKTKDWARRWLKSETVRYWPGYWQKHELMATAKEIYGIDGDPYITAEKIEALIDKTEQVSADLKDVPIDTADMVKKTDEVTKELKEAKADNENRNTAP